jgi:FtsP/CotA-like multicopper oxidase with cupredoxin domain
VDFPSSLARRHILSGLLAISCATLTSRRSKSATEARSARLLHARPNASSATAASAPLLWGYEGVVPGPTLEVRRGEEVWIRLVNELPEPTALHWHGVRLPNAMDGAPPLTQQPIAPGESFDYRFIAPDAGTYWYHPPRSKRRGLYGMLIVHEPEPVAVNRDVALIFDDWRSDDSAAPAFTVNGAPSLEIRAGQNERIRLRLLNASDEAIFAVRVDRLRPRVMAIDGQPAQPFTAREGRLLLGPGNRADVFVDCTLTSGQAAAIAMQGTGPEIPIAQIICDATAPVHPVLHEGQPPLPTNDIPERMELRGALRFDGAIDRPTAQEGRPLFTAKRGRTVVLGISNPTEASRSIHLHGHSFRVLDALDDGWTPYWLDTIPIAPRATVHLVFVADNPGKWLIEGLDRRSKTEAWFEVR